MIEGETIYSSESRNKYTVFRTFKSGGQAEVAYATSDKTDKIYFIKRLISIKYNPRREKECEKFFSGRKTIYDAINKSSPLGASCSHVVDFFREGSFFYVVYERICAINITPEEFSRGLTFDEKILLLKILAYSLRPFESNDIVHCDLKPENFLYKVRDNHLVVKLIDFESACLSDSPPEKGMIIGTEPYYSPELFKYNIEDNDVGKNVISFKSDIFALGVIFLELLLGSYPFNKSDKSYVYEMVSDNKKINQLCRFPEPLRTLISKMLDKEPSKRPSIMQIVTTLDEVQKGYDCEYIPIKPHYATEYFKDYARFHLYSINGYDIYYSNGGEFRKYDSPIKLTDDALIKYYYVINGVKSEIYKTEVILFEKSGKVAIPIITISGKVVEISCLTPDAEIFYTIDGSRPTRKACKYLSKFTLESDCRINAIAVAKGKYDSDIVTRHSLSKVKIG